MILRIPLALYSEKFREGDAAKSELASAGGKKKERNVRGLPVIELSGIFRDLWLSGYRSLSSVAARKEGETEAEDTRWEYKAPLGPCYKGGEEREEGER